MADLSSPVSAPHAMHAEILRHEACTKDGKVGSVAPRQRSEQAVVVVRRRRPTIAARSFAASCAKQGACVVYGIGP